VKSGGTVSSPSPDPAGCNIATVWEEAMVNTPNGIDPRFADANVRVEVAHWDGCGRVAIIGEIDLSNVHDVEASLTDFASSGTPLTLDLIGLSYLDSQGVAMIFRLAQRAQLNGGTSGSATAQLGGSARVCSTRHELASKLSARSMM
jgi:anti-anti-sigma factor